MPAGFEWLDHQDAAHSVISFVRHARDGRSMVMVVVNLTPTVHHGFRIGVPRAG